MAEQKQETPRPWHHLPLELRFDSLPMGRCSIFDAKGYSLVIDMRADIARRFIATVNAHDELLAAAKAARDYFQRQLRSPAVIDLLKQLESAITNAEQPEGK